MKELPKIFKSPLLNPPHNNLNVYYSKEEAKEERSVETKEIIGETIDDKINRIFTSPTYVYKMKVEIEMKNGQRLTKQIVGRHLGKLITMDNELLPISDIKDIRVEK